MGGRGRVVCVDIGVAPYPQKKLKGETWKSVEEEDLKEASR
jgi:hypothetical protein